MNNQIEVAVLLMTYNGEKYLRKQIESIIAQTFHRWKLYISDDNSKDGTLTIVEEYQSKYPEQIIQCANRRPGTGLCNHAMSILSQVSADYYMFCDQDDVWFPDKIENMVKAISEKEKKNPKIPLIVHTEVTITDQKLEPISPIERKNYIGYMNGYDNGNAVFERLLFQNVVQAASMIFNQKLYDQLTVLFRKNLPRKVIHDSLIASVASIQGKIFLLKKPYMYYRQHDRNAIGASKLRLYRWMLMTEKEKNQWKVAHFARLNRTKCLILKRYYKKLMTRNQNACIDLFMKDKLTCINIFKYDLLKTFKIKELIIIMLSEKLHG